MKLKKTLNRYAPTIAITVATLILLVVSINHQHERFQLALKHDAELFQQFLTRSKELKVEQLTSLSRYFASSNHVTRNEFREFVKPMLNSQANFLALGWIPQVSDLNRIDYTNSARMDGLTAFEFKQWQPSLGWTLTQESWAVNYYPVYYLEPMTGNESALGIDLGSHLDRRQSIDQALSTGQPVATEVIELAQGGKGLLILLALQDAGINVQQNGLMSGVIRISDFFEHTFSSLNSELLQVSMAEVHLPEVEIYSNQEEGVDAHSLKTRFDFINRQWILTISPGPKFIATHRSYGSWFVALVGLILISLVFRSNLRTIAERRRIRGEIELGDRDMSIKTAMLELNEERHKAMVNVLVDAVITMNEKGIVQEFNPAAERLFGYKAKAVIGENVKMLMPEPTKQNHDAYLQQYSKTRIPHIIGKGRDVIALRKNGSTFEARLSVSEFELGERLMFVGVLHDLTHERKLISEQLVTNRQLQLILDTADDGICGIDVDGIIRFANRSAEATLGYESNGLIGLLFKNLLANGDTRKSSGLDFDNRLVASDSNFMLRQKIRKFNESILSIEASYCPIVNDSGSYNGAVIVFRDISARELAENKTEAHHRDLDFANAELERANKDLEQFAYIASHDLKAPLRAIKNLAEWVVEDLGEKLQGDSRENMDILQNRVSRLDALLTDLLEYSRAGRGDQHPEDFNSDQIIRDLVDLQGVPADLTVEIASNLPVINGIRSAFEIVIRNLISNAIKHHDKPNGKIQISFSENNSEYVFSISDDGPGIAHDKREKVFELFVALDTRQLVEGSGMGLSICRKAAEFAGGRVWIDPEYSNGSRFLFSIPKQMN